MLAIPSRIAFQRRLATQRVSGEGRKPSFGFAAVTTDASWPWQSFTFNVPAANVVGGFSTAHPFGDRIPSGNTLLSSPACAPGVVRAVPGTLQFSTDFTRPT